MIDLPMHADGTAIGWLGQLLYDSFGLTRWQSLSDDSEVCGFRMNPSSGGLQPLEVYILAPVDGIPQLNGKPVLLHYNSFWHAVELLCELPLQLWEHLARQLPAGAVLIAFTSFYFRTCWKYGEVSFAAIQRDLGHAIGCVTHAAMPLGLHCAVLEG